MGLVLKMLTKDEFFPEHDKQYVAFLVSDFYGEVEYTELRAEFYYAMIDAEDGYHVPCSCTYKGEDGMPFCTPLMFNAQNEPYVLSEEEVEARRWHEKDDQRFYWHKTWMLIGNRNLQLHPEELDSLSLGIMAEEDFMNQVVEANKPRLVAKEEYRSL